jgi:predicted RNA binding protein YcfA (HicA-like mRNA interferase family)
MSKPTIITSVQMCKFLERHGFKNIRQRGSHCFFLHGDGRTSVVPMHAIDLDRTIIRKILKDLEVSIDDYNKQVQ